MTFIETLQRGASPALDGVALLITNLGSEMAYIAMLVIIYLSIHSVLGRRIGIILMLGYLLNFHLKALFNTPRPFEIKPDIVRGYEAQATGVGAAFPSGHAQGSTMFWGTIALSLRRRWVTLICLLLIALISLSRLYLGVHYPIDVVGGVLIGVGVIAVGLLLEPYWARLPRHWRIIVGVALPLALQLLVPTTDSEILLGALVAFIVGPELVAYEAKEIKGLWRRCVAAGLGLILVFAVLLGSSLLLPETLKEQALIGFIRYALIGFSGLSLAPWLLKRFRLAA